MGYMELYHDINEEHRERLQLVKERIAEIAHEKAASVSETYRGFFIEQAGFLMLRSSLGQRLKRGGLRV